MNRMAEAWNTGNARKAAECYTEDVVYLEPPDQQVYMGRQALYEFLNLTILEFIYLPNRIQLPQERSRQHTMLSGSPV